MKKEIKLKKGGKVALTIILVVVSAFIYSKVGSLGELAQTNRSYEFICVGAWIWLLIGQMLSYILIWEV